MGPIKMSGFVDELEKIASGGELNVSRHALELVGLGTLMAPSVQERRGKHMSEKRKADMEIAGLGMLAAPYVKDLGEAAYRNIRKPKNYLRTAEKIAVSNEWIEKRMAAGIGKRRKKGFSSMDGPSIYQKTFADVLRIKGRLENKSKGTTPSGTFKRVLDTVESLGINGEKRTPVERHIRNKKLLPGILAATAVSGLAGFGAKKIHDSMKEKKASLEEKALSLFR